MDAELQNESERLARSWAQYDQSMLRDYLVAGVEDPRINIQSVLTRHFLTVALFSDKFGPLFEHELRFALVMNWLLRLREGETTADDLLSLYDTLKKGGDNAEGIRVPAYVTSAFASLPATFDGLVISNYLTAALQAARTAESLAGGLFGAFERAWHVCLSKESAAPCRVLEAACGSANDYRFLHSFGLARLIEYTGFDLCEKNIANAKELFPEANFKVGNVFSIEAPDRFYDCTLVHDLFEHLSLPGLERALSEILRVTANGLCFGFFNLHEGPEHVVQPTDEYFWNGLSVSKLTARLEQEGFDVHVIHIDTFLKWRFGCADTHNKNAYTFFARRANSPHQA